VGIRNGGNLRPVRPKRVEGKDLVKSKAWNLGALVAQGCHAATSAIWTYRNDPNVQLYCSNLESMHKVVLEAKDESDLLDVDSKLKEGNIDHVVWREQPENIITAIATKPYAKSAFGT
ncbi:hypothetical protein WA588_000146, partial [Blastocystis sp. NMH]